MFLNLPKFTPYGTEVLNATVPKLGLVDKKLIMMVRDRGHALTIEITLNAKGARMEYFIPKICNVRMVNDLPGLFNPVDKNSVGATGAIETSLEELPSTLYDFISRVPMDHDMEDEQKMSVA